MSILTDTSIDNRLEGKRFEDLVKKQAKTNGLLIIKNHLTARWGWRGRLQVIPGELDFRLITQEGRIAYVDAKSFAGDRVEYSDFTAHQVARANLYNEWNIPSGFIVHLRATKEIVFFTGTTVLTKGPRTSLGIEDGLRMGTWDRFDLKLIFARGTDV